MKIIRILHEWPLSKVELVEIDNDMYILKTIHKDFENEIARQKLLYERAKGINIPKIYSVSRKDNRIEFLMEYIEGKRKTSRNTALEVIRQFHEATRKINDRVFPRYTFDNFYSDFLVVRKYLTNSLNERSKDESQAFFKGVFDSKKSVVHGDWGTDQILVSKDKPYVVDFGKSFYGPSILDFAFMDLKKKKKENKSLLEAKIVAGIITLSWLELCRTKYIKYDYKKEIKNYVDIIDYNLKRLK